MPNWTLGPEYIRLFGNPGAPSGRPARAYKSSRPPAPGAYRLPPGQFSRLHVRCVNAACTTPEKAYAGRGYCQGCYWLARQGGAL